jgi:hypothetical protein
MKAEFIRCPHCGLLHPTTARSCPATGAALPQTEAVPPEGGRGGSFGVAETTALARLVVQTAEGERTFYLRGVNSLGRHPNNSIQILDKIVSKEHCRIEREGERFILRDLGSLNGTYLNGERVRGVAPLGHGDLITLGATRGVFYEAGAPGATPGEPEADTAAERFLAHLTLDKPLYQPGETLYARAAVLDAESRAPLGRSVTVAFEVRSLRGDIIAHRAGQVAAGVAPFSWAVPSDLPGGDYTLFALFPADGFPPAEMAFSIRAYLAVRHRVEIAFAQKAYGPGDEVEASLSVRRANGGAPADARVTLVAKVDELEVRRSEVALDAAGDAAVRFRLPKAIEAGEGTLAVIVTDAIGEEMTAKPIPIEVRRVRLSLYPEGGDLVIGLPARLYIEAQTPAGKPVEVAGRIVDGVGAVLGRFRTEHEGRGSVTLTPAKAGRAYMAVLDEPTVMSELFPLPEVLEDGLTLTALDDATSAEEAVRLRISSTAPARARVVLYAREREVAAVRVDLGAGEAKEMALTPPGAVDGVLRATVYDVAGIPRAERLVFRRPRRSLRIAIEPTPARASLGSPVAVRIRTTSAEGQPVSATVTIAVVDAAVLDAAPRRERPPRLPVQALLGSEVLELGDPEAYLGEDETSRRRLDLLLGTQGWRRLAFYDVSRFIAEHGDRAARVLARRRPVAPALGMLLQGRQVIVTAPGGAAVPLPEPNAPTAPRAAPRPELPRPPPVAPRARPDRRAQLNVFKAVPRHPGPQATLREYAHRAPAFTGTRENFVETLYWNAGLSTRDSGEATIAFDLADSVTSFRIRADGFGADGALGAGDATIEAGVDQADSRGP